MAKRTKYLFPTGEIPHLWATANTAPQSCEVNCASNPQRNLRFDGVSLTSYSTEVALFHHRARRNPPSLPVAKVVGYSSATSEDWRYDPSPVNQESTVHPRAVLISLRKYSNTTSGHLSAARQAVDSLPTEIFVVPIVRPLEFTSGESGHDVNRKSYENRISSLLARIPRARTRGAELLGQAEILTREANRYAAFFGLRWRIPSPMAPEEVKAYFADSLKREEAARKKRAAQERKRYAEILAAQEEEFTLWREGKSSHCPKSHSRDSEGRYLLTVRMVKGRAIVLTSDCASVPGCVYRRLWPLLARVKATGSAYVPPELVRIGHYTLSRIESDGTLVAGCHRISYEECERAARILSGLSAEAVPEEPCAE